MYSCHLGCGSLAHEICCAGSEDVDTARRHPSHEQFCRAARRGGIHRQRQHREHATVQRAAPRAASVVGGARSAAVRAAREAGGSEPLERTPTPRCDEQRSPRHPAPSAVTGQLPALRRLSIPPPLPARAATPAPPGSIRPVAPLPPVPVAPAAAAAPPTANGTSPHGVSEAADSGPRPSAAAEELRRLVAHAKQTVATLQAAIDEIEQRLGPSEIGAAPPSEPSSSRSPSRPSWLASVAKKVRSSLPS